MSIFLSVLCRFLYFAIVVVSIAIISDSAVKINVTGSSFTHRHHLVVISHGLMGTSDDLTYLALMLRREGASVLLSKRNELLKSLRGIEAGASDLVAEIVEYIHLNSTQGQIKFISFVGNSLGGLFARNAIRIMRAEQLFMKLDIEPYKFMTIATPHLGVYYHNQLDELNISVSNFIKKGVSNVFSKSGRDLFSSDSTDSLLYRMATDDEWLQALKDFKARRLYANILLDSVVPLGTGAFLPPHEVNEIRQRYKDQYGIVTITTSSTIDPDDTATGSSTRTCDTSTTSEPAHLSLMRSRLNGCGWEKVFVNFPGNMLGLPLAHNKICALTRWPHWFHSRLLGFDEGRSVMENAAEWLTEDLLSTPTTGT